MRWLEDAGAVLTNGPALFGCAVFTAAVFGAACYGAGFRAGRHERAVDRVEAAMVRAVGEQVGQLVPGQRRSEP